jgi:hypothetical protein
LTIFSRCAILESDIWSSWLALAQVIRVGLFSMKDCNFSHS